MPADIALLHDFQENVFLHGSQCEHPLASVLFLLLSPADLWRQPGCAANDGRVASRIEEIA